MFPFFLSLLYFLPSHSICQQCMPQLTVLVKNTCHVKPNTFNHRDQQLPLISFSKTSAASVTCVEILDTDDGEYEASSSSKFSSSNDMRSGKDPLCCGSGVLIGRFTRSRVMQSCQPTCPHQFII